MENESTSFVNISIPNISIFIFHHSIQHDEASSYAFYNDIF